MNATSATKILSDSMATAAKSIIGSADYIAGISKNAAYAAGVTPTPMSYQDTFVSPSNALTQQLGNMDYTVPIGSGIPAYSAGVSPTPMSYNDVRITVDTTNTSDEWAQLVAKSLLISQKNGYSQSVAGYL